MKKYRIYIDESGNSDLESSDNPNHRFLSLTGIIIELEYVKDIVYKEMESLKRKYFNSHPDEPVILHRKDMINKRYAFKILKNKNIENDFNKELLNKLNKWDYKIITVLIDKKEHRNTYKQWKYDPYHYCLAVLLERYVFFLEDNNLIGDVMVESRGGKDDKRLKKSFSKIYNEGTDYIDKYRFEKKLTSKQLKAKPKNANISGLQLADLIAHPSKKDILLDYELIKNNKNVFGDRIIDTIKNKYYSKYNKVLGYGKKKLP